MEQSLIDAAVKRLEPHMREMYYKCQESVLIALIISFTKLRDVATVDEKPGLVVTVDALLKLLESHRDMK